MLLPFLLSCSPPAPVAWRVELERVALSSPLDELVVDSAGRARAAKPLPVPSPEGACPGSVRAARRGAERYAAWWSAAPSGPATLMFSRSTNDGATWSIPLAVDTRDAGNRGCDRPAPAIAAGEASEYVHLAYWLEPSQGAGVFFSHSMDGGDMFHEPVAAAYGGLPAAAAVASIGDTVVVAHEDPNSPRPRVLMALSRTAGHIFEHRLGMPETSLPQTRPRAAIRQGEVIIGWVEPGGSDLVLRRGDLRVVD